MYKILRIVFSVVSALLIAACVFIFIYLGALWGVVSLIAAAIFFGLTLLFKYLQEREEFKLNPPPPKGDFITGPVKTDYNNDAEISKDGNTPDSQNK
jgi:hypothetical protein